MFVTWTEKVDCPAITRLICPTSTPKTLHTSRSECCVSSGSRRMGAIPLIHRETTMDKAAATTRRNACRDGGAIQGKSYGCSDPDRDISSGIEIAFGSLRASHLRLSRSSSISKEENDVSRRCEIPANGPRITYALFAGDKISDSPKIVKYLVGNFKEMFTATSSRLVCRLR